MEAITLTLEQQDRNYLGRCPLLRGVPEDGIARVLDEPGAELAHFSGGQVVYSPQHFSRRLGILLSGSLQVTKGELTVSCLEPGELFGAAALYCDAPQYATTITARRPSRCLMLDQALIDRLLEQHSQIRENYLRYLTGRIRFLSNRLQSLAQAGAEVVVCNRTADKAAALCAHEPARLRPAGVDPDTLRREAAECGLLVNCTSLGMEGAAGQFEEFSFLDALPAGDDAALQAVGGLLSYLYETQKTDLSHLSTLTYFTTGQFMELDLTARRNLELTETLRSKEKKGSLLWVLDKTRTAMGHRLIRAWMERPLLSPAAIGRRLGAVGELVGDAIGREELTLTLREITDLERLIGRIVYGTAGMLDGVIDRIREQFSGRTLSVVATGGNAPVIVKYCRNKIVYDKYLLMDGLWAIYQKNK